MADFIISLAFKCVFAAFSDAYKSKFIFSSNHDGQQYVLFYLTVSPPFHQQCKPSYITAS